jgi:hypothetical protein
MKGDELPSSNHVSRYCGGIHIAEDGRILPTAFHLRPQDESVSVNWLESLQQNDRASQIREVRQRLEIKLRNTAKIAVLNVGEASEHVRKGGFEIRILHEPKPNDDSHSGIFGIHQNELVISMLIAEKISETYQAVER